MLPTRSVAQISGAQPTKQIKARPVRVLALSEVSGGGCQLTRCITPSGTPPGAHAPEASHDPKPTPRREARGKDGARLRRREGEGRRQYRCDGNTSRREGRYIYHPRIGLA